MKRVLHPSGINIMFDAKWHQYKIGNTALRSVSKVLDKHFPFEEKRILELVSKKTGQSVEEVKSAWNRQALLGKNIHEYIECKLLGLPPPTWTLVMKQVQQKQEGQEQAQQEQLKKGKKSTVKKGKKKGEKDEPEMESAKAAPEKSSIADAMLHGEEAAYLKVADMAVDTIRAHYDIIVSEQIIACPDWGLAGTIDFIGRNKKTNKILIGDWKTSGTVISPFRFGSFETPCTGCLMHLPNSKFHRYAMQVIVYGEILKREGYLIDGFFGRKVKPVDSKAVKELVVNPRDMDNVLEYGIVQMAKNEEGQVCVEFKKVTEETVLPVDAPETRFMELLKNVMQG